MRQLVRADAFLYHLERSIAESKDLLRDITLTTHHLLSASRGLARSANANSSQRRFIFTLHAKSIYNSNYF